MKGARKKKNVSSLSDIVADGSGVGVDKEDPPSESDSNGANTGMDVVAANGRNDSAVDTDTNTAITSAIKNNPFSAVVETNAKCQVCLRRLARDGCTQRACIQCCTDISGCVSHQKPRAQTLWKEQVLAGTTETQLWAAQQRRMRLMDKASSGKRRGFFREPGFVYQGDTVVIWDIRSYASNPKWKEDAIRKSVRRNRAIESTVPAPRLRNNRKRFQKIMNDLYLASLLNSDDEIPEHSASIAP